MKSLLLFCGLLWTCSLSGQNTWAQALPFSAIQPGFCGLYQDEDAYYLSAKNTGDRAIMLVDKEAYDF
ncbi:MAG: hypothetical protein ACR2K1_05185 [Saprospiraceae bacterium]